MNSMSIRNGLLLGGAACIALLMIMLMFQLTRHPIQNTQAKQLSANLSQLLEANSYDNEPSADTILISNPALGTAEPMPVYRARANNQPVAAVLSAISPNGYNGPIAYLIGFSYEGGIIAVRVTSHNETPGLGDDIEARRSDWILSFNGLQPEQMTTTEWQVKKDGGRFDQFTGATITPRALVHSIHQLSQWYVQNRDAVFAIDDAMRTQ